MTSRRDLLLIGGAGAVALAIPPILRRQSAPLTPIPGAPGFFREGAAPSALNPLAGLDGTPDLPRIDLCATLFRDSPSNQKAAFFTDHRCPNCPRAHEALSALQAETPDLTVTWHNWPVFGPTSDFLARLDMAARAQGADISQLLYRRTVTPGSVKDFAVEHGLDPARLAADIHSPVTKARLAATRSAAAQLGVIGTPTLILNATLTQGAQPHSKLAKLLKNSPPLPCS